jgi:Fe-S cluster assembly protein SufD
MVEKVIRRRTAQAPPGDRHVLSFDGDDVRAVSARLGEPRSLAKMRRQAWKAYQDLPMPAATDEAWRRMPLAAMPGSSLSLKRANETALPRAISRSLKDRREPSYIILRPGLPTQREAPAALGEKGVIFCDWATAVREHSGLLSRHTGSVIRHDTDKLTALVGALASDGLLIYVPPGVELAYPLQAVLWAPGNGRAFFSRVLVVVGEGSSLTLVLESASPTGKEAESLHVGIVELIVQEGAKLRFVELQNWGHHMWNLSRERTRIGPSGEVEWIYGALGSHVSKSFLDLNLDGQGASARFQGLFFGDGQQHLEHNTQQNHMNAHTTSDLLIKGALTGSSRSVWRGMVYVSPQAQQADGYQANRNLLLSGDAHADSIPGLEILADAVRCSHAATVSQLEEEPIYYLMTRGIEHDEAAKLLLDGFFNAIVARFPNASLRKRVQDAIHRKLG